MLLYNIYINGTRYVQMGGCTRYKGKDYGHGIYTGPPVVDRIPVLYFANMFTVPAMRGTSGCLWSPKIVDDFGCKTRP